MQMNCADLSYRKAEKNDLETILKLIVNDQKGQGRDSADLPIDPAYENALEQISSDPNNDFYLCIFKEEVVGCFQLTFIPGISRKGAWRGQIEAVRVLDRYRSHGIGSAMMRFAIELCRERNCRLVQLTSDKSREEAHSFYSRLGFEASHEGFKLRM